VALTAFAVFELAHSFFGVLVVWSVISIALLLWSADLVDGGDAGAIIEENLNGFAGETGQFLAGPAPHDHFDHLCSCHSSSSSFTDHSKSGDGRIFYQIGIHNNRTLEDALYLFRGIRDARNIISIHIDTKFGLGSYNTSALRKEIEACPCGSRVEVESIYDCAWGSWGMVMPTLYSMHKAVTNYAGKWDAFINLSGDTLPVYSQNRIAQLIGGPLKGINFVTSIACETGLVPTSIYDFPNNWHKRSHYSHNPPDDLEYVDENGERKTNVNVEIYFGSQWVTLTPQFCEFMIKQLHRDDSLPSQFRDWLIRTGKLMSDETFFATMLMYYFPETIPKLTEYYFLDTTNSSSAIPEVSLYAIRYERLDEHVPNSRGYYPTEQRYEVPPSSGIEQPHPWGPYFLG
jgi:hypothetical protein